VNVSRRVCLCVGDLISFARSCSPVSLPELCIPGPDRLTHQPIHVCYSTCSKNGCNGYSHLHRVLDLLRRRRQSSLPTN